MRLLLTIALSLSALAGERQWIQGKVESIERRAHWIPQTTAAERAFGGGGLDRQATLYKISTPAGSVTVADIPQSVFSGAPKPHCAVGDAVKVEAPANGNYERRVRVVIGGREKRLYLDSHDLAKH